MLVVMAFPFGMWFWGSNELSLIETPGSLFQSDPDDPNGPDLDLKLDEIKENIRKAETEKIKAESVIECFRDGGVNVDEWMKDVETLAAALDIPRSGSSASLKTDASSGVSPIYTFVLMLKHYSRQIHVFRIILLRITEWVSYKYTIR